MKTGGVSGTEGESYCWYVVSQNLKVDIRVLLRYIHVQEIDVTTERMNLRLI